MAYTIAVAGKGGTGKTTISGLIIDYLGKKGLGPILAVDADANSNLNEVLGVDVKTTIGDIREEIARSEQADGKPIPEGITKADYMDIRFNSALVEDDEFDMVVMGRTQGQGCYCFVNGVLTNQIEKYSANYKYVVVDNEAGMEHISRGVLPGADIILLISDCSRRGIQTVGRISKMIKDLKLAAKEVKLIVNQAPGGELNEGITSEIEKQGLDLIGVIPRDELVFEFDSKGKPTVQLPEDSASKVALREIMVKLGL